MEKKLIEQWLKVETGSGDGSGIKEINGNYVFEIDGVLTIITSIHFNIAKGFIANRDLTLTPTFLVKGSNMFAHGKTIKEAMQSLQEKIYSNLDAKEQVEEFRKKFNNVDKYSGEEFFSWHHILTGSCLQGRQSFVENSGYKLTDMFTVKEFLKIVKNQYGWEYIKVLEEYYK